MAESNRKQWDPKSEPPPTPAFPGVFMPQPSILYRCILSPPHKSPLQYEEYLPFMTPQPSTPTDLSSPTITIPWHPTSDAPTQTPIPSPLASFPIHFLTKLPIELRHQIYTSLIHPWTPPCNLLKPSQHHRGPIHTPMRGPVALARILSTPDKLPDISYQAGGRSSTSFYSQRLQVWEWKGGRYDYFSREDLEALRAVEKAFYSFFLKSSSQSQSRNTGSGDDYDVEVEAEAAKALLEDFMCLFWGVVVLDLKGERGGWFTSDWKGAKESGDWLLGRRCLLPYIQHISLDLVSSTISSRERLEEWIGLVRVVGEEMEVETVSLWVAVSREEGERILSGGDCGGESMETNLMETLVKEVRKLKVRRWFRVEVAVLWIENGEVGGVTDEEVYEERSRGLKIGLEGLLMPDCLRGE